MKNKINNRKIGKWQLLFLLILMSIYSCKEKPRIVDPMRIPYHLERTCIDMLDSANSVIYNECNALIEIAWDTTIQFDDVAGNSQFRVVGFSDSLFIPLQTWKESGNQASFQGGGKMTNDSLFIHYEYVSNSNGSWNCDCVGKTGNKN